jgi:two-component system nitrogen regulation sensor histidine kinase NtrY
LNRLTRSAFFLILLAMVLGACLQLLGKRKQGADLHKLSVNLEQQLGVYQKGFNTLAKDTAILNDLITNTFASSRYEDISAQPYGVLLYVNNELLLWTRNTAIPPSYLAGALAEGSSFLKLENGYYEIIKKTGQVNNLNMVVLGMIPVKSNYRIENRYLDNSLNPDFKLPDYIDLSPNVQPFSEPVKSLEGNVLFYLTSDQFQASSEPDYLVLGIHIFVILLVLCALNLLTVDIWQRGSPWIALLFFVTILGMLRAYSLMYNYPGEFYKLGLFNPQYYASSAVNKSLGDLLINIVLFGNGIGLFFTLIPFDQYLFHFSKLRLVLVFGIFLLICLISQAAGVLFNNLLLNSSIPFDLNNFMSLNAYSIIGLLCLTLALFSYFLVSYKLLLYIQKLGITLLAYILLLAGALAVYALYLYLTGSQKVDLYAVIWIPLFVLFLNRQIRRGKPITSFANGMIIVILFSMVSALYMQYYNSQKENEQRELVARKLTDQRDRITEYLFSDIQERIFHDAFIRNYFLTPFISTEEVRKRIRTLYFGGYFSKYDLTIYIINKEGQPLQEVDNDFYELEDPNAELSPPSEYLFFIPKEGGSYLYSGNLPIHYQNKFIGTIVLKLSPKTYSKTNLYPELLLEENIKPTEDGDVYGYGIYVNDMLTRKEGIYPYNSQFNFKAGKDEYTRVNEGNLVHLIYNAGDNKKVVITSKRGNWLEPTTLFSYLFCFYLIFAFLALILRMIVRLIEEKKPLPDLFSLTFKDKIQYAMIFILVTSFFIIGLVTIIHFTSQYDDNHIERLVSKQVSILANIEYELRGDDASFLSRRENGAINEDGSRNLDLTILSDVHSMDVNLYDLQGNIINTSQPDIYEKGLISEKMNAEAYKNLVVERKSQYINNEVIGTLRYLSIYVPVQNLDGRLVAYLNLPYFAKEKELREELASYLVALINVYVFLLVMGGFIAYILSNSITASLSIISEKLKFIQLGRKNEPIEWKGRDEIGTLVNEYNKMIHELEQSAERLARSERESAWREMAKQVAHEIKNPLTPMKLAIQHLQRALAENRPGATELARKMSVTLIEQIDSLNHIASEFSSFAKMPAVQNEVFDLGEVVHSVADLFNEEADSAVTYKGPNLPVWVYSDKNQVLRAFNNLVKNATQAIPEGRKGKIKMVLEVKNNFATVTVIDNGSGIPVDVRQKVFVPNFTTKGSGTGLGLALTRQIVESAGGEIWFESVLEEGTTFFVKLPLYTRK